MRLGLCRKKWIDDLTEVVGAENEEILHLALEFAVDALLIREYDSSWGTFCPLQAGGFVEKAVQAAVATSGLGLEPGVQEVCRLDEGARESCSTLWPVPDQREVDEGALLALEGSELSRHKGIDQEGLEIYYSVLMILLQYPAEIRDTITAPGRHWQDALVEPSAFAGSR